MTQSVIVKDDKGYLFIAKGCPEMIKTKCSSLPEDYDEASRKSAKAGIY